VSRRFNQFFHGKNRQMLSEINPHERDKRIVFYEDTHTYLIDDVAASVSSTGWIGGFFSKFDPDTIIQKNQYKWSQDITSKYYAKSSDEIKQMWEDARDRGTLLHNTIELFYNNDLPSSDIGNDNPLKSQGNLPLGFDTFLIFHNRMMNEGYRPYRTEWFIFGDDIFVPGAIDMVYVNPKTDGLVVCDWKHCLPLERVEYKWGKFPCENIPDCKLSKYFLQINYYSYILSKWYGKTIERMLLVNIQSNDLQLDVHEVPNMFRTVRKMISFSPKAI
jgi:hypothetical protein